MGASLGPDRDARRLGHASDAARQAAQHPTHRDEGVDAVRGIMVALTVVALFAGAAALLWWAS